jgi:hypothetical protein
MTAKGHGRFGAVAGEGKEPLSLPAREQDSKCVSHVHKIPAFLLFPVRSAPFGKGIAAIRYSMFSGDTLPPNSPNGGEYHTQMKLAAFLFFLHERFHHGSTPDPLLSSGFP